MPTYVQKSINDPNKLKVETRSHADANTICLAPKDEQGNWILDADILDLEDELDFRGNRIGKKAKVNAGKKAAKEASEQNKKNKEQEQMQKNEARRVRLDQWVKDLKKSTSLDEVKDIVKDLLKEVLNKDEP